MKPGAVTLREWRQIYRGAVPALDPSCLLAIERSAATVAAIIARGEPVTASTPVSGSGSIVAAARQTLPSFCT
jgi:histidine ammonia-lyase